MVKRNKIDHENQKKVKVLNKTKIFDKQVKSIEILNQMQLKKAFHNSQKQIPKEINCNSKC